MADDDDVKVVRLPISVDRRWRNLVGPGYVPCQVSMRWLRFPKKSEGHFGAGEFLSRAKTYSARSIPSLTSNASRIDAETALTHLDAGCGRHSGRWGLWSRGSSLRA
jgi:hypothetical protein